MPLEKPQKGRKQMLWYNWVQETRKTCASGNIKRSLHNEVRKQCGGKRRKATDTPNRSLERTELDDDENRNSKKEMAGRRGKQKH